MSRGPAPASTGGLARLTTSEVCRLLRISRATLWRRVRTGALPAPVDRGRQALFAAADLAPLLERRAVVADDRISEAMNRRLIALARRRAGRP